MTSEDRLFDLLDDLESQAEALYATERDVELADRSRAEYVTVTLASRLMASVGRRIQLEVQGTGPVRGELRRVATGWCLVAADSGEWPGQCLVALDAVVAAEGVSPRSVPEVAWPATSRLGLGSALRRLADEATPCVVVTRAAVRYEVVLTRVGADFVEAEVRGEDPRRVLLALGALAVVRSRGPAGS